MIKIAICGINGRMGKVVHQCLSETDDFTFIAGIDITGGEYGGVPVYKSASDLPEKPDVIIDYSNPASLEGLLDYTQTTGTPLVIATTGFSEEQKSLIKKASENIPIFFTFNMSLGINLLSALAKKAAAVLSMDFDIEIIERHHNQKLDAPSGTALLLADSINQVLDEKYRYEFDRHSKRGKRSKQEIGIHAVRGGTIVGQHEVMFAGRDEIISLSHTANSREIFAVGSVNAARFLVRQPHGLYNMDDLISA